MLMKQIPPDFGIDLYTRLLNARRTMLQPALNAAVKAVGVAAIDPDLQRLVPAEALTHLASLGLRGERVFPTPALIRHAPPLIGYYRMLLGLSRKEFRQSERLNYGPWESAERRGRLSTNLMLELDQFCLALIAPLARLVSAMGQFDDKDLNDLTLLTLGPTFQGGRNNVIGIEAAGQAFEAMRSLVRGHVLLDSNGVVRFQTRSAHVYEMIVGADPDISVTEGAGNQTKPLLAVEVKGGRDASNAYNRAGEAEKSHIAAARTGFRHRWTIIHMAGAARRDIVAATPNSTEVFDAAQVFARDGPDWRTLKAKFAKLFI